MLEKEVNRKGESDDDGKSGGQNSPYRRRILAAHQIQGLNWGGMIGGDGNNGDKNYGHIQTSPYTPTEHPIKIPGGSISSSESFAKNDFFPISSTTFLAGPESLGLSFMHRAVLILGSKTIDCGGEDFFFSVSTLLLLYRLATILPGLDSFLPAVGSTFSPPSLNSFLGWTEFRTESSFFEKAFLDEIVVTACLEFLISDFSPIFLEFGLTLEKPKPTFSSSMPCNFHICLDLAARKISAGPTLATLRAPDMISTGPRLIPLLLSVVPSAFFGFMNFAGTARIFFSTAFSFASAFSSLRASNLDLSFEMWDSISSISSSIAFSSLISTKATIFSPGLSFRKPPVLDFFSSTARLSELTGLNGVLEDFREDDNREGIRSFSGPTHRFSLSETESKEALGLPKIDFNEPQDCLLALRSSEIPPLLSKAALFHIWSSAEGSMASET
ncbi:ARID/BRIGHT DNA-binding domain-containing protein [Striga asiatica]|uniref:ARID/BRIGHT DNA-binding domain-containing protein n=1 Tax=Striga asiatica TaxID=4170 RepID=A0A5A7QWF3_STRAF|nr:ARID/BRIGHT DNA-binding domain-containing protein [Striga asiatica]